MKGISFFILLLSLLTSCFQSKQPSIAPVFSPGAKGVIKVIAQDLEDTATIYFQLIKILPREVEKPDKIKVWGKRNAFLNFSIDRPTKASLAIGDSVFNCFVAPNDTTLIYLAFNQKKEPLLRYSGITAPFNQYYQAKQQKLGYANMNMQFEYLRHDSMDMQKFKREVIKISKRENRFLDTYSKNHPLPAWFLGYEKAEIGYLTAGYLLQIPFYYRAFNIPLGPLPNSYYNFLPKLKINNPKAVLTSSYHEFLSAFFIEDESPDQWEGLHGYKRSLVYSNIMLKKANQHLSGQVRSVFLSNKLSSLLPKLPASYPIDSLLTAFQLEDAGLMDFSKIYGQTDSTISGPKLAAGDTVPNFYAVNELDSLVELRQFSDKTIYLNLWASWCKPCIESIPEKHQLLERMKGREDFLLINLCIDSKEEKWKDLVARHRMQGINLFAAGNWSEKIKNAYQVQGIPQYMLLSKGNRLVENYTNGPATIDKLLLQQLQAPPIKEAINHPVQ